MPSLHRLSFLLLLSTLTACASHYTTPGRGANMETFGMPAAKRDLLTDAGIRQKLALQPLAAFPTALAVVRAQAPGYRSYSCDSYGSGSYSVVTTRDAESDATLKKLSQLPMVTAIAPVNRLLLPNQLNSDLEVRQAAASLHADLLLVYTIDTEFRDNDNAPPITLVTLGLFPTTVAKVNSTASAVLLDTRNGYVYAVAEASAKTDRLANSWTSSTALDNARRQTESEALDKLVTEFESAWKDVVTRYGPRPNGDAYRTTIP